MPIRKVTKKPAASAEPDDAALELEREAIAKAAAKELKRREAESKAVVEAARRLGATTGTVPEVTMAEVVAPKIRRKKSAGGGAVYVILKDEETQVFDNETALQEALGAVSLGELKNIRLIKGREVKLGLTFKKG